MKRLGILVGILLAGMALGYVLWGLEGAGPGSGRALVEPPPSDAGDLSPRLRGSDDALLAELTRLRQENAELRARIEDLLSEGRAGEAESETGATPEMGAPTPPYRISEERDDSPLGILVVHVASSDGSPAAGMNVYIYRFSAYGSTKRKTLVTDEQGAARAEGLVAGKWSVTASFAAAQGSGKRPPPSRGRGVEAYVLPGRTTDVTIPSPFGAALVTGRVLDSKERPMPGVLVMLIGAGGFFRDTHGTTTDEKGVFRLERIPAGPHAVAVTGADVPHSQQALAYFDVPDSGTLERDVVVGRPSLWGTVTEAKTGAAIADARLKLQGAPWKTARSNARGMYRFFDLAPGSYRVAVVRPGFVSAWLDAVEVSEQGSSHDIQLEPAARLDLHVVDSVGNPYTGSLKLRIVFVGDPDAPSRGATLGTDAAGHAAYNTLSPGVYRLSFVAEGAGTASATVDLRPGDNALEVAVK